MPGNTLGARRYYKYTSDDGTDYKYLTDLNLGTAVEATLDDTLPGLPRRFKPRGVYVEAEIDGSFVRKFLTCPLSTTPAYAAASSTEVTIDEQAFKTTGRRGEKTTFGANPVEEEEEGEGGA